MKKILLFILFLSLTVFIGKNSHAQEANRYFGFIENIEDLSRLDYGYMETPEDHENASGKTIDIAWTIIKAKNENSGRHPIIFLTGGPGGETLPAIPFFMNIPLSENHDIILFDQRGIGHSSPLPDFGDGLVDLLAADLTPAEEEEKLKGLLDQYREKARQEGLELHNYNSFQSAGDAGLLMEQLGYEKYHIMGGSYGTRLARIIMEKFPGYIDSAILDSPNPFGRDFITPRIESYEQALGLIIERCSREPVCRDKYPDLKNEYISGIVAMYENPVLIELDDLQFYLNPQDAIYILRYQLYRDDALEGAPALIRAYKERDKDHIRKNLEAAMPIITDGNYSMFLSVERYEHFDPAIDRNYLDELYSRMEFYPAPLGLFTSLYLAAESWHSHTATPEIKRFTSTDIPTIIYVNKYDPVTPPEEGRIMNKTLNNGYLFILDEGGHGGGNMECKLNVSLSFFGNSQKRPDTACLNLIDN